jgi:predicted small lipoprotein YifL
VHKLDKLRYEEVQQRRIPKRISMQTSLSHLIRLTAVLAVIGLAVAGCGRKGDLDPPSVATTKEGDVSKPTKQPGTADKPFLLDPLL